MNKVVLVLAAACGVLTVCLVVLLTMMLTESDREKQNDTPRYKLPADCPPSKKDTEVSSPFIPFYFLRFGKDVNDTLNNGTRSLWVKSGYKSVFLGKQRENPFISVDAKRGTLYIGFGNDIFAEDRFSASIIVNQGSGDFRDPDPSHGQYLWNREIAAGSELARINCMISDGFQSDWAFVATWIDYEGSTFQVVIAGQSGVETAVLFNYGDLSEAHANNTFAIIVETKSKLAASVSEGSFPRRTQIITSTNKRIPPALVPNNNC